MTRTSPRHEHGLEKSFHDVIWTIKIQSPAKERKIIFYSLLASVQRPLLWDIWVQFILICWSDFYCNFRQEMFVQTFNCSQDQFKSLYSNFRNVFLHAHASQLWYSHAQFILIRQSLASCWTTCCKSFIISCIMKPREIKPWSRN